MTNAVHKTQEEVSDEDRTSHPRGVARRAKFPVATLFVTQGTHDNVASDRFVADFLTVGEYEHEYFVKRRTSKKRAEEAGSGKPHLHSLSS